MKIVYIKLTGTYSDNWTYQENIIPLKFKELGNEVHVIVNSRRIEESLKKMTMPHNYINKNGITVHRLPFAHHFKFFSEKMDWYPNLYNLLKELSPDFIFVQCLQFVSAFAVAKYVENNPKTMLAVDNHADQINMPLDNLKRKFLHRIVYKTIAHKLSRVTDMFFGVSPSRSDYLNTIYGVDRKKIRTICQGGDEKIISSIDKNTMRDKIFKENNIPEDRFCIVSGAGNIDKRKKIYELLQAVKEDGECELILFGFFSEESKKECAPFLNEKNIHYIGMISGNDTYKYMIIADMCIFPGTHSVLWDKAVACGTPVCLRKWAGMDYFDVNGNCVYIEEGTKEEIIHVIQKYKCKSIDMLELSKRANKARDKFEAIKIAQYILTEVKKARCEKKDMQI